MPGKRLDRCFLGIRQILPLGEDQNSLSVNAQGIPSELTMHREQLETQLPMTSIYILPSKT